MQGFVTRRNPDDPDAGTLNADQAITIEQAVRAYTLGAAHTLEFDWPEKIGSLKEGKGEATASPFFHSLRICCCHLR